VATQTISLPGPISPHTSIWSTAQQAKETSYHSWTSLRGLVPVFDEFHILEEVGAIMEQGVQELDAQQTFITIPFKLLFANR